jgi:hypothetical protein
MNSLVKQLEERDKEEKDKYSQFFADCMNEHKTQIQMVNVSKLSSNRRNKSISFQRNMN